MREPPFCQEYLDDPGCDLGSWPYQVKISMAVEREHHYAISRWCSENLGDWIGFDTKTWPWRHSLAGSPSMAHPLFCVWLFKCKDHAVQFQLVWGGASNT